MTLDEYAKSKGLKLKQVAEKDFADLASRLAFPYDNPHHFFLKRPFIKGSNFIAAADVSKTYLYWTVRKDGQAAGE